MADNIVIYVDNSEVRPGKVEQVKAAIRELALFVEANEKRVIAYRTYVDESSSQMTVIQVHPDAESLEFHMQAAGSRFAGFEELIRLLSIDVYGAPGVRLLGELQQKARRLGGGVVRVHTLHAGFARLQAK